jgi:hypothetical protein
MANALQNAGALSEPTSYAPLHTNRIFTGLWTNRSPLRDAATSDYQEHYGMGRQDSIWDGFNSEISPQLTLKRRYGTSVYNTQSFAPIKRFYSFNTFTLTDEVIVVMADTATTVYDATSSTARPNTKTAIFTKSHKAGSTYFLGVGNTLYMTNGVDNVQWNYLTNKVGPWGVPGPVNAPTVGQALRPNTNPAWRPSTAYCVMVSGSPTIAILDPNNYVQKANPTGLVSTGSDEPVWSDVSGTPTPDGGVTWHTTGIKADWTAGMGSFAGQIIAATVNTSNGLVKMFFVQTNSTLGDAGPTEPNWPAVPGLSVQDGVIIWTNFGLAITWKDNLGANCPVVPDTGILDPDGYLQNVLQPGRTSPSVPKFLTPLGALTYDSSVIWSNVGPFAVASTAPVQYGYAYEDSASIDISNMSPKSLTILVTQGNQVTVTGDGSARPQDDTIIIYRTAQGGSTFFYLDQIPNPGATKWNYIDNIPDADLNTEIQAQVGGEGTPLPAGATCLGYHLGRIFAAVGNVVYVSSGPDAVASGSSGNAGFDTTFTAQSKITRFWVCSLGMVVFTVRDAYIILGSATDADPLYMVVFIDNLPLRSYDCFTLNRTTPYLLLGNNQAISLDPSAGIIEIGFPIADRLESEFNSALSYVTFHSQSSRDSALYIANGTDHWYRLAANSAPEQGSNWSTRANIANMGCVQSVEVDAGQFRLLIGQTVNGQILQRDRTVNTDAGVPFAAETIFGNIVLAQPGQLAAMSFITLESMAYGSKPGLGVLLGEISGTFDPLLRTRQDPTNLPPSTTLYSDRYHFQQNQKEAWCRHFQMMISWPAEDAANELLTFTIFGQTWQEMRSQ